MVTLESSSSYVLDQQRGTPLNIADTAVNNNRSINRRGGGGGWGFRAKITLILNRISDKATGNKICRVGWGRGLLKSDRVLALRETSFPIGPK